MSVRRFSELKHKLSPAAEARVKDYVRTEAARIRLAELRKLRSLTQEQIASKLRVRQSEVSKLERRSNMKVRTLSDVIGAMGGRLILLADFQGSQFILRDFAPRPRKRPRRK